MCVHICLVFCLSWALISSGPVPNGNYLAIIKNKPTSSKLFTSRRPPSKLLPSSHLCVQGVEKEKKGSGSSDLISGEIRSAERLGRSYFVWINSKIPNVVGQKMLGLLCFHCKDRLQPSPPRAASRTECPGSGGACPTGLGRARVALSLSAWLPGTLVPMAAVQAHPSFCAVVGFLSGALPVVVESCKKREIFVEEVPFKAAGKEKRFYPGCGGGKTQSW